jgi:hypothetical protein
VQVSLAHEHPSVPEVEDLWTLMLQEGTGARSDACWAWRAYVALSPSTAHVLLPADAQQGKTHTLVLCYTFKHRRAQHPLLRPFFPTRTMGCSNSKSVATGGTMDTIKQTVSKQLTEAGFALGCL